MAVSGRARVIDAVDVVEVRAVEPCDEAGTRAVESNHWKGPQWVTILFADVKGRMELVEQLDLPNPPPRLGAVDPSVRIIYGVRTW